MSAGGEGGESGRTPGGAEGGGSGASGSGGEGHRRSEVVRAGPEPGEAHGVVLLLHGRGGSPEGMLELAREIAPPRTALLAPRAHRRTWYPESFLAPLERNEPWLSSALAWLEEIVAGLAGRGAAAGDREGGSAGAGGGAGQPAGGGDAADGPAGSIGLVGFSQGACLALEYVARHPRRYGGVAALSGGLIGPPGRSWDYDGSLEETPVFLGCSDRDPHIPEERVHESAEALNRLGADVTAEIYPGFGHTVNEDEIARVRAMLETLAG